jgi:hypothetical protein
MKDMSNALSTWHTEVNGVQVIKVGGTPYEMGLQHGTFLRRLIPDGPLPYFRTYLEKMLAQSSLGPAGKLAYPVLQKALGKRVAKTMPDFALETIRGLADGSGLDYQDVLDGCTMPDALLVVVGNYIKWTRAQRAVDHRTNLGIGCTSAIAWGDATTDGKLLHARNFDYYGVGCWPRTAAVAFHDPEGGQRFVSACAAGIPMGGATAMNEAGLTLTVHQHMFTDAARLGGTPIGLVGDIVMREATNLDEAEAILREHKPIGCWTYLIADGKRRELLCWEEDPRRQAARRVTDESATFAYANIYLDEELARTERNIYGSYWRHNEGRFRRARTLLEDGYGDLDPQRLAEILGDEGEGHCRLSRAIGMLMTTASVVFSPEDGLVWVGTGQTPTSHGTYECFDLNAERHAPERGTLQVGDPETEASRAFEVYRQAYIADVDDEDHARSRVLVDEAVALQPDQPLYRHVAGLLALRARDTSSARAAFTSAIDLGHEDPERVASFHLWRARAHDVAGDRAHAQADYRRAIDGPHDRPVGAAARRGLKKPYSPRRARHIHVDFAFADIAAP